MPVRRSPDPRRIVVITIASLAFVIAVAVVTTVFSGFGALGQRYVVLHFDSSVSKADRERVQEACADPPVVRAVPLRSAGDGKAGSSEARYRVDEASEGDIAVLSKCLKKHDGVLGIDISDLTTG